MRSAVACASSRVWTERLSATAIVAPSTNRKRSDRGLTGYEPKLKPSAFAITRKTNVFFTVPRTMSAPDPTA